MTTPDVGVYPFFSQDHRDCDGAWVALEEAASGARADETRKLWKDFAARMERHFRMEEEVLFPAFEDATGMHGAGPTEVMRIEHNQMRALLAQIGQRVDAGDLDGVLDHGDTLMMLVAQHNAKEENMLYPMADNALHAVWDSLAARLHTYIDPSH
ncbi:MAG: hemerythrin domain-containing protein [Deltaproteobacteria bacterium]|nr:hemerythrin domain-containing protein [Deltaproteobacteria bacterium]